MHKVLYLVRHCEAAGQQPEAGLTAVGMAQAERLARVLAAHPIERLVSSPFARARQSLEPLARLLGLPVDLDERLRERVLGDQPRADWLACLHETFADPDRRFGAGETTREATARAVAALADLESDDRDHVVVVSHGNLTTLLLRSFDDSVGVSTWQRMTNPDVFRIRGSPTGPCVDRLWTPLDAA
jgi:2,3-bisphosphoglycerate-dependent phosphoglycerate mutase